DQNIAGSAPYLKPNDNVEFQTASVFYGGAITEHIGAYAQFTYNAQGFGPPVPHLFTWDNLDIRYANTTNIAGMPAVFGLTVNNNPTVQDPWNSTPAWGYPFVQSNLANTPGAKTLIDQGFAAQVLGMGGYAFLNDQLYLEATGYQTLSPGSLNSLGVNPINTLPINGVAPYFRAAYELRWGKNSLEVGTFGLSAETSLPLANPGAGTNRFTDIAFDSQYQYQGDGYWITVRGTYIHEKQYLAASVANGLAANLDNTLNTFRANAALTYGTDGKVILTGGYFNTWGSSDTVLYGGNRTFSPNSDGFIGEIAYQFFGKNNAPKLWPWFNARVGVQYIAYDKFNGAKYNFDGMGTNARDNNTLLVYLWTAF
ncbi:MAG: cytochrome C, partial [Bradyrhizobium sp.]|uniref:cytochrome C n=1 Tax=Bradyrhizobium sp. TaxID=376 RepID=UPI001D81A0EF